MKTNITLYLSAIIDLINLVFNHNQWHVALAEVGFGKSASARDRYWLCGSSIAVTVCWIVRFAENYVRRPVQEIAIGQLEPPTISSLIYPQH
ncbi:hypothetical protein COP2_009920 [Malus domestica]